MIKYTDLGADKQLNEIVFAGSHDAGITGGAVNVKTQKLDILGQAQAGVRFFDIRIAATKGNAPELKTYHGAKIDPAKMSSRGAFGEGLTQILTDANSFLTGATANEFLILKFDKCSNWTLIANQCRQALGGPGGKLYTAGGNVNTKTLGDLSGKVIVAFMTDGFNQLGMGDRAGITPIKNLYKPPDGYRSDFDGLQYWGSGGTKINDKSFNQKIQENITTQKQILNRAATGIQEKKEFSVRKRKKVVVAQGCGAADPDALGMMYWTTTGVFKNIKERNKLMWQNNRIGGLRDIWESGLSDYIDNAVPDLDAFTYSSGGTLKLFMPNIVMIDFAKATRCDHIYALNQVAAVKLAEVAQAYQ